MLSREEPGTDRISRRLIEDTVTEQLKPLRQEMLDLKGCLREIAAMMRDRSETSDPDSTQETKVTVEGVLVDINETLRSFSTDIQCDHTRFFELLGSISKVQDRSESWSKAAYVLNGHTFTSSEMILDLLARFVVIPQINATEPEADAALIMKDELDMGRQQARKQRKKLESRLDIPDDAKTKFLSIP